MKLLSINRASRSNRRLWTLALAGIQLSFATFGSFAQSLPKLMNSALLSSRNTSHLTLMSLLL